MSSKAEAPQDRQPRRKAVTRERVLTAAAQVIGAKGFQRASLDEIAAQAGLTKGAIYSSFRSKDELFLAVVAGKSLRPAPHLTADMTALEYYRELGEAVVRLLPEARAQAAFVAEFELYALTHDDMRQGMADLYAAQFAAFTRLAERHPDKTGPFTAQQAPVVAQALALGLVHQAFLTPDLVTPEVVIAAFEAIGRPAA
jgi:AcrR family transcriptional regulator